MDKKLSTEPYKGTRDFYPEDMAVERYIFDTWAKVAESFGFERYDASILEPSELYRSKGAENEELVNEQTYTFVDRGEREVTLRPEMTPTVARMVAGKRRELSFPVRWYSIPNLFRYERPQRGRLREHWQLNCDMFGVDDVASDIEMIALGYRILLAFGASPKMFEIRVNDRTWLKLQLSDYGLSEEQMKAMLTLIDKRDKIDDFDEEAEKIAGKKVSLDFTTPNPEHRLMQVIEGLKALGIENVVISPSTVRGFSYYTGTIFEFFDTASENNRSLLGGGRYDNLTALFGGDPVSGVGFGMGDVTMRDFLETHSLLTKDVKTTAPTLAILPLDATHNLAAEVLAEEFRSAGVRTAVDLSDRKVGKKLSAASDAGVAYVIVLGEDEAASRSYALKNLGTGDETKGSAEELAKHIAR
ncbi:MAG TPA: histidine--tRNA ligase [Candidatus Paceibacterota bacterium]|nr:histidine--tRNA ligase [Candidatus Paceibacterota bacterium]